MFKITKPDNESFLSKESSEVTISSNEGVQKNNNNENILAELSNSVYSNQLPEINESSIFQTDPPSTPADQNENLNLNNESIVVDEFEYHYKHELDTNNLNEINEQEDLSSTRHRSSSLQDTNLANESILSLKSNTSTESASVSKSPVSQISDILSNKDDTNVQTDQNPVNKVEEALTRSESSESSSSSSTDSNDWLDVQKAINEYQKLNLDEDYNDNEILSVHDDVNTDKEVFVPVDLALSSSDKPIEVEKQVKSGGKGDGGDDSSSSSDDENETNQNNNRKDEDGSNKDNKPSNSRANYMVDSMDDVIIDCKVDYRIRNEDSDSSITDTMSSSMVSERRNSEYDNLNSATGTAQATVIELGKKEETNPLVSSSSASLVDVDGAALSTSINSVASLDNNNNPNNNPNNETLPSFTSITSNEFLNKSYDEEEETVEYSFVEDFTDLSKELDENWIQDDDVWFGSSASQKPLANTTTTNIPVSMHPPRLLHRIEEEESSLSVEAEHVEVASSSETLKVDQGNNNELIIDAPEKYAHLLDNVEEFKMTLEYEFKQDAKQDLVIIKIFSLISIRIEFKIFVLIGIFNFTIILIFCPI